MFLISSSYCQNAPGTTSVRACPQKRWSSCSRSRGSAVLFLRPEAQCALVESPRFHSSTSTVAFKGLGISGDSVVPGGRDDGTVGYDLGRMSVTTIGTLLIRLPAPLLRIARGITVLMRLQGELQGELLMQLQGELLAGLRPMPPRRAVIAAAWDLIATGRPLTHAHGDGGSSHTKRCGACFRGSTNVLHRVIWIPPLMPLLLDACVMPLCIPFLLPARANGTARVCHSSLSRGSVKCEHEVIKL
jgi:hypothetical protein